MIIINENQPITKMAEGVTRKNLGYSKNIMSCEITMEKGATVPMHAHVHEQVSYIIEGSFALSEGELAPVTLKKGDSFYMGENVPHSVHALEKGKLIDTFTPVREDFL